VIDLKTKQAFWAEQLPIFKEKYWLPDHFEVLEFDMIGGCFEIAEGVKTDFSEDDLVDIYHRVNSGWAMWKKAITFMQEKAKAEPVPEVPVLTFGYGDIDVMEGIYQGSYSLMLGKNGGGVVGGNNQANRFAKDDELHVVFKFHNEKSIRVVIDRLLTLHKRLCNKEPVEIKDANGEVIQTIYASDSGAEG